MHNNTHIYCACLNICTYIDINIYIGKCVYVYFIGVSMYVGYVFIYMYTFIYICIFTNRYSISSVVPEPYNFKHVCGLLHLLMIYSGSQIVQKIKALYPTRFSGGGRIP